MRRFHSFYYQHIKEIIHEDSLTLRQPPSESPTRSLGMVPMLKWLRDFGVMLLYFTRSEKCGIDDKILNSLLFQLPSVCKQLFLIERAMSILMVDDKPSIHLVLPMTSKLKYLPENNMKNLNKTEEYVAKLIAKNYYEEPEKGCLKIDDKMKDIYAISFSLFPYAYCFSKDRELVDECNEIAAGEFVQRARVDGIHDDERMKE